MTEISHELSEAAWCAFRDSSKPAPYNQIRDALEAYEAAKTSMVSSGVLAALGRLEVIASYQPRPNMKRELRELADVFRKALAAPALENGEEAALRAELASLEAAAPLSARETARYLEVERRLSALENSKASLADAHSNDTRLLRERVRELEEAVAAEREACAKIADGTTVEHNGKRLVFSSQTIAKAIRARSVLAQGDRG